MKIFKRKLVPVPKQGRAVPLDQIKAPLGLEIGCGTGDFALEWTQKTGRHLIAIEKTRNRFLQFKQKYEESERPANLWPLHTNAVWWLAHYGKTNSFEHIFLLYPNPYPKKKQSHLRWINRPFMPFLLSLLKEEGVLELRTNKSYYYKEFKEKIKRFPFLSLVEDKVIPNNSIAQSLFEKKYLERGDRCWLLRYQKDYIDSF